MTKEEILQTFSDINYAYNNCTKYDTLKRMLDELTEPCDDAISRAELLKAIDTWDKFGVDDTNSLFRLDNLSLPHYVPYIRYDDVIKCINGIPSVTSEQKMGRWIPVSERLPEPYEPQEREDLI